MHLCLGLLVSICGLIGCSENTIVAPAPESAAAELNDKEGSKARMAESVSLEHDFGIVYPGERCTWEFDLRNASRDDWTLEGITHGCRCVVAELSDERVRAGETLRISVAYRASTHPRDDRQALTVRFKQLSAPLVRITLRAQVRAPITVIPRELDLGILTPDKQKEAFFEVMNYSGRDWDGLQLAANQPWIRCRATEVVAGPSRSSKRRLRQRWRCSALIVSAPSTRGAQTAAISVRAVCGSRSDLSYTLPLRLEIAPEVEWIPKQLFFGRVKPREPSERRLLIRFSGKASPNRTEVLVTDDVPGDIHIDWRRDLGRVWDLRVVYVPDDATGVVRGHIRFDFGNDSQLSDDTRQLLIPLYAWVHE